MRNELILSCLGDGEIDWGGGRNGIEIALKKITEEQ